MLAIKQKDSFGQNRRKAKELIFRLVFIASDLYDEAWVYNITHQVRKLEGIADYYAVAIVANDLVINDH